MTFFGRIRNTVFLARPTVDGPTPYSILETVTDPRTLWFAGRSRQKAVL